MSIHVSTCPCASHAKSTGFHTRECRAPQGMPYVPLTLFLFSGYPTCQKRQSESDVGKAPRPPACMLTGSDSTLKVSMEEYGVCALGALRSTAKYLLTYRHRQALFSSCTVFTRPLLFPLRVETPQTRARKDNRTRMKNWTLDLGLGLTPVRPPTTDHHQTVFAVAHT